MKTFVGIDLGTTNSAICSYDGKETRIWKSPEQNDVTPSAIYIDKRGNKYVGQRAYDTAPHSPQNSATLFKRYMGTSTTIKLAAINKVMTPEECSAEVLKVLFGYLSEEIRNDEETGTVITVPAAFNQMQKDATMQAAQMAGIGNVALMQEPVAAVMSVMKTGKTDGIFLIFDLGGGTLDVAIAQSIGGRVSLLAHGGIAMCGGRDCDRAIMDNIVIPWLKENFNLPDDFIAKKEYNTLKRMAEWAVEKAKIELSSREEARISLSEIDTRAVDLDGNEIYIDIPIDREKYDPLIEDLEKDAINAARETLEKAGIKAEDVEKIVFVGGPTNYKPLRDKVSFELGMKASTEVNPMTPVAEGASIFAESIDWSSKEHSRKSSRGRVSLGGNTKIGFNYISRTSEDRAKIACKIDGQVMEGAEFQIDSLDTGWSSGRAALKNSAIITVELSKHGENAFKIFVFDANGGPITVENDKIIITKTTATIDAIPASHSVGIAVKEKLGGADVLDYIIKAGDSLPQKGQKILKAGELLKAGAENSLVFKLYEGEIDFPVTDNRLVGTMEIHGNDFTEGVIPVGADLLCDYEVFDSGLITLSISVPCIRGTFNSGRNFYTRITTAEDYQAKNKRIQEDSDSISSRLDDMEEKLGSDKVAEARKKVQNAKRLNSIENSNENTMEAEKDLQEAKKLIAKTRRDNLSQMRQMDLDSCKDFFDEYIRPHARPSEATNFDNLVRTAQRQIDNQGKDFENMLSELKGQNFLILFRQDWFIVGQFKHFAKSDYLFQDKGKYQALINQGTQFMKNDEIDKLRDIVILLGRMQISSGNDEISDIVNIIRG